MQDMHGADTCCAYVREHEHHHKYATGLWQMECSLLPCATMMKQRSIVQVHMSVENNSTDSEIWTNTDA